MWNGMKVIDADAHMHEPEYPWERLRIESVTMRVAGKEASSQFTYSAREIKWRMIVCASLNTLCRRVCEKP